jgi:transcriptional regulator with XRE-family HTH domain
MPQVDHIVLRREPNAPAYVLLRAHLTAARKAAGMSQEALAKRIGRPQSFIAKLEGGERSIDVIEFLAIARAIGLNTHNTIAAVAEQI